MTISQTQMANAIRALSMDAIQAANSGHPGMPMGMADVASILFTRHLKFDPAWPEWPDRDRFILSAGHGSMLLYSLLYLSGYDNPTMEDIKNFRQLHQPCAGHPEVGELPGVEMTTGPLGQGLASSVGFALAERLSNARMGDIIDHHTYVICGDGCLMEGISHEAISMAGHLKLGKMIVLWDDNEICIDGSTRATVSDDQLARFAASGWHTQAINGHDMEEIDAAITAARQDRRPSMIACRTTIGYGAPTKQGTSGVHGAPLGAEEIAAARKMLNWPHAPFVIPEDILGQWRDAGKRSQGLSEKWKTAFDGLDGAVKADFTRRLGKQLPADFADVINDYKKKLAENPVKVATRKASLMALDVINPLVGETIGGSADLTGSNLTRSADQTVITADDFSGRYIYYGVREFAMAAVMNGLTLHGEYIPYGGTFLVFTDYCRSAIRLSALMKQRAIYVMTHDSIGLGEDGPTHQPVEHLMSLRVMPNLAVYRPADAVETAESWACALQDTSRPSVLALTRQGLTPVRLSHTSENLVARGAYELRAAEGVAIVTIIATGSEVELAVTARKTLQADGIPTRVVSMPSTDIFDEQPQDYRDEVLGNTKINVSIEAGSRFGWERYVGRDGIIIGMDSFGASAPAQELYEYFGITADAIVSAVKNKL
ncbi:Transketolase [hydrothermal vent metagenome]|uniref:transketolase n=1 Tax=hydrothermal vent metagenome TaxID=652676 RepID=A0A3B0S336_9ZZZZ